MTTYAFVRPSPIGGGPEIIFTSDDPAKVAERWREPDAEHLALRALEHGQIVHPSVADAQAVYAAKAAL